MQGWPIKRLQDQVGCFCPFNAGFLVMSQLRASMWKKLWQLDHIVDNGWRVRIWKTLHPYASWTSHSQWAGCLLSSNTWSIPTLLITASSVVNSGSLSNRVGLARNLKFVICSRSFSSLICSLSWKSVFLDHHHSIFLPLVNVPHQNGHSSRAAIPLVIVYLLSQESALL